MHFCTDFRITLKCFCCHKNSHRTPLSAQEFWALLQTWTTHGFMLQTRAECLIFRSATRWLYPPVGLSRDQPWSPSGASGSWAWAVPALPSPWDAHGPRGCTTSPLWALTVHVSLGKPWIVLLTSPIPYQTLPFYYPEDFWLQSFQDRNCSLCSSMHKAVQYPSWAGERLFSTLSELLLSLVSFFNYALKTLFLVILDFWWVFFPHERKQVEMITKLSRDKKITATERGLRKREEEKIAWIKPQIR